MYWPTRLYVQDDTNICVSCSVVTEQPIHIEEGAEDIRPEIEAVLTLLLRRSLKKETETILYIVGWSTMIGVFNDLENE